VFTLAVAFAQDVTQFTALRFIAGLGLGACLPTALAYMSEHAPKESNSKAVTRTMTGYHVGAVLTARGRLQHPGGHHPPAGAERRRGAGPPGGGRAGRRARQQEHRAALVRPGGGVSSSC